MENPTTTTRILAEPRKAVFRHPYKHGTSTPAPDLIYSDTLEGTGWQNLSMLWIDKEDQVTQWLASLFKAKFLEAQPDWQRRWHAAWQRCHATKHSRRKATAEWRRRVLVPATATRTGYTGISDDLWEYAKSHSDKRINGRGQGKAFPTQRGEPRRYRTKAHKKPPRTAKEEAAQKRSAYNSNPGGKHSIWYR